MLVVCWLLWFAQARAAAEHFAPGRLRHHPRMAVLAWLVPAGTLYLPEQIANDIWHASSPPGRAGAMAPAARLDLWWSSGCSPWSPGRSSGGRATGPGSTTPTGRTARRPQHNGLDSRGPPAPRRPHGCRARAVRAQADGPATSAARRPGGGHRDVPVGPAPDPAPDRSQVPSAGSDVSGRSSRSPSAWEGVG
ncbi:DUF4328 domain-containing protein [Streptomyces sp. SID625]|nr:DUF4328 domain-containing protein [Streptomyces sp. SID625]